MKQREQFLDYDHSKMIKDLGFDEKCMAHYENKKLNIICLDNKNSYYKPNTIITAPSWYQVEEFFWKKYKAYIMINVGEKDYVASLVSEDGNWDFILFNDKIDSPVIAKNEGIKKSIEWLYKMKHKQYLSWKPKLK